MVRRRTKRTMSLKRKVARFKASLPAKKRKLKREFKQMQKTVDQSYARLKADMKKKNARAKYAWQHRKEFERACKRIHRDAEHSRHLVIASIRRNYGKCLSDLKKAA